MRLHMQCIEVVAYLCVLRDPLFLLIDYVRNVKVFFSGIYRMFVLVSFRAVCSQLPLIGSALLYISTQALFVGVDVLDASISRSQSGSTTLGP